MGKRNVLILLLGLFFYSANGQSYKKILPVQKITVNYVDHSIVAELLPAKYGKADKDRFYAWVSGNQIVITQGGYSGKLLNGDYRDLYSNKNLKEFGRYVNGLKEGVWKNWNEEGILTDSYHWAKGMKHGKFYKYDSLGRVVEKGKYRNNRLRGKHQLIEEESIKSTYYKKGEEVEKYSFLPKFVRRLLREEKEPQDD